MCVCACVKYLFFFLTIVEYLLMCDLLNTFLLLHLSHQEQIDISYKKRQGKNNILFYYFTFFYVILNFINSLLIVDVEHIINCGLF